MTISSKNALVFRAFWISELYTILGLEAGLSHNLTMFPNSCDILEWQQNKGHKHKARFWLPREVNEAKSGGEIPRKGRGAGLEVSCRTGSISLEVRGCLGRRKC